MQVPRLNSAGRRGPGALTGLQPGQSQGISHNGAGGSGVGQRLTGACRTLCGRAAQPGEKVRSPGLTKRPSVVKQRLWGLCLHKAATYQPAPSDPHAESTGCRAPMPAPGQALGQQLPWYQL